MGNSNQRVSRLNALQKAVESGDESAVAWALQNDPDAVNQKEIQLGWTPLHIAAWKRSDAICRQLIRRGATVDATDKEGRTALHLASMQGGEDVVKALLRGGASPNVQDKNGHIPRVFALQRHPSLLVLLDSAAPPPPLSASSSPSNTSPNSSGRAAAAAALASQRQGSGDDWGRASSGDWGGAYAAAFAAAGVAAAGSFSHPPPPVAVPPLEQQRAGAADQQQQPAAGAARYGVPTAMQPAPPLQDAHDMYARSLPQYMAPTSMQRAPSQRSEDAPPPAPRYEVPATMQRAPSLRPDDAPTDPWAPQPRYGLPATMQTAPPLHAGDAPAAPTAPPRPRYEMPATMQRAPSLRADDAPPSAPPQAPQPRYGLPATMQQAPPLQAQGTAPQGPRYGLPAGMQQAPPLQDSPSTPAQPAAAAAGRFALPTSMQQAPPLQAQGTATAPPSSSQPSAAAARFGVPSTMQQAPSLTSPGPGTRASALETTGSGGGYKGYAAPFWLNSIMSAAERARAQFAELAMQRLAAPSAPLRDPRAAASAAAGGGGSSDAAAAAAAASVKAASALPAGAVVQYRGTPGQQYRYPDLYGAALGFAASQEVGSGDGWKLYKGVLDGGAHVAIRRVTEESLLARQQGRQDVEDQVALLSQLRHPHIVQLLGGCCEKGLLVYERMAKGSLEEALWGDGALGWRDRVRVVQEVASGLLFLHSAPEPILHLALEPSTILLDQQLTAKIADVGMSRLSPGRPTSGLVHASGGGAAAQYIDPRDLPRTNSKESDIHSLGVVMLQLLTGQNVPTLVSTVEAARATALDFEKVIDPAAGGWPAGEAMAFADLALKCVRKDRADLRTVILPTLLQLKQRTVLWAESAPAAPAGTREPPQMFLCPITQDIMADPVFAADGYTYERDAIAEWITKSPTSPLTNIALEHTHVTPNHNLRSAIMEWKEQQRGGRT